jgi:prevent-host-death family protein
VTRHVSTASAKARLSELIGDVAHGRKRVVIERRGRPVAALVSMEDAAALDEARPIAEHARGALALLGAWADVDDATLDQIVDDIYATRVADTGRSVDLIG